MKKEMFMFKKMHGGVAVAALSLFAMTGSASADTLVGTYNLGSSPAISASSAGESLINGNILYVSGGGAGVDVIDTAGTATFADDTLVGTYTTSSTPALPSNIVRHVSMSGNLLYLGSNGNGLTVIDTAGTAAFGDDTLLGTYSTSSTPALPNDVVVNTLVSGNTLYVGTNGGVTVIDTNGTAILSDDTILGSYNTSTSPALSTNGVNQTYLFGNVLYVSTQSGTDVIDTNGTATLTDDTLLINYSIGYGVYMALRNGNVLYLVSPGSGMRAINTQGTTTVSDDVTITTYNSFSIPQTQDSLRGVLVRGNLLYVSNTSSGMTVIDTNGTISSQDDTISATYNTSSSPALAGDFVYANSFVNATSSLLYIPNNNGLTVFELSPLPSAASSASDTITVSLPVNSTISITSPADVTMGAITGTGQSALTTNQAEWITKTNNAAGYELSIQASSADMTNANLDTVAGYTPATPGTPEPWSIAITDSEWGMHYSFPQSTLGNDTVWGADDTYADNWINVPTTPYVIETATAPTDNIGDSAVIIFGAEVGSDKIQPTGNYSVDVTMTATTL